MYEEMTGLRERPAAVAGISIPCRYCVVVPFEGNRHSGTVFLLHLVAGRRS